MGKSTISMAIFNAGNQPGDKNVDVDTVPSGKRLHSELENHHFSWENPL